ncbi:ricin-type beta-trefoil lectin domain protein [Kitasatospora sp. NBC_01539]|uniref:ricin-type beta-trefoil lectin domain protein n=1 Tax=Kitasatospora sp. NBC_01539 TaxID=2903577 RepID=UPI00386008DF
MKRTAAVSLSALVAALGGAWGTAAPAHAAAPAQVQAAAPAQVHAAALAATTALRLEPLGDSLTYGSHSSAGNGYRQPLWNALTAAGYRLDFVGSVREGTMADADNTGLPGWRIDAIASITDGSLATYKPNVVTLMAGTNDLVQKHDVSTAPDRLSALVDRILADDPGVTVLVANLIASTNPDVAAAEPAYNAAIPPMVRTRQSAGKHVQFVDMGAVTTADLVDPEHPGDAGYRKMADAWSRGIQAAAAAGWLNPPAALGAPSAGAVGGVFSGIRDKCLDVDTGSSADGTPVQLWSCNRSPAQQWSAYSDNTLRALGKCLDATAGGTADGTRTQLYTCNGSAAQVWQPYNGGYLNPVSGRCLDDPGGSATDGTRLALWGCNTTAAQQWGAPGVGPVTSGVAGKCLDDAAGSNVNGTKAEVWDCNGSAAQQWVARGGTLGAGGLCLDVRGGATANGTLVQLWDCNGGSGQSWKAGANSALVNTASGRCLDIPNSATSNGTQLVIWDCNGGVNQTWAPPANA